MTGTVNNEKSLIKIRSQMFNAARRGEKPICPKCRKGHIFAKGDYYFECNSKDCGVFWTLNAKR